jgi:methionyl-tRNA synthetase
MLRMLNVPVSEMHWENASKLTLEAGHKLNKPEILFKKIEDSEIEN